MQLILDNWQFNAVQIVITISVLRTVHGRLYQECLGADKSQKFVASLESCAKYIYCDGNNSFEGECLDDNYFNVKEGKCDERAAVVCAIVAEQVAIGGIQIGQEIEGSQGLVSSVGLLDGGRVDGGRVDSNILGNSFNTNSNKNNMNNNKYTSNNNNWISIISQQQQQQQQLKQQKQQNQLSAALAGGVIGGESVTGLALNAIDMGNTGAATVAANQSPQCPLRYGLRNILYLPNEQSCATYYTCYNGIAIPMICPSNTYFSEASARCERQDDNFYCPLYRPVRLICNRGVYDYIPHSRNCGYYYLCSNGYLMIFQCPFQLLWHYERRTCVHYSQAKCFTSAIAEAMLS